MIKIIVRKPTLRVWAEQTAFELEDSCPHRPAGPAPSGAGVPMVIV
jgi:hypothetical protein